MKSRIRGTRTLGSAQTRPGPWAPAPRFSNDGSRVRDPGGVWGGAPSGYALCWAMLIVFAASVLLGTAMTHTVYFSRVTDVSIKRAQARSDLYSLTSLALKWLKAELETEPGAVKSNGDLTDSGALCIFSLEDFSGGSVKIFDLGYDPLKIKSLPDELLLLFPPSCPDAYLVRATVEKRGLAPMTEESVFVLTSNDVPGGRVVYVLEEKPLYSRELFR